MTYIPNAHMKYDVLPFCRKKGREVFAYPVKLLYEVNRYTNEEEMLDPYGYKSYEEYYDFVDCIASRYVDNADIFRLFETFKTVMKAMNCKEEWSILKYIGETNGGRLGLTNGKNYYWPCSKMHPVYEGVIDGEEYTSFWYRTDSELWEILEDPTGMAHNTIFKQNQET